MDPRHLTSHESTNHHSSPKHTPRAPPFRPEHARLGPPRIVPAPIRMVEEVFGLAVQVISDPLTGTPLVLPLPRGPLRRRRQVWPSRDWKGPQSGFGRARSSAIVRVRHCRSSAPVFARARADYAEPSSRDRYLTEPLGSPDRTCQAVDPRRDARLVFTYQPALM